VFEKYQQTWIKMHTNRGWEYRLWTDAEVSKIQLINQVYYDEAIAQQQYGAAADILRWEIIYRFGGVYVDMDYECLRSLDIFHYSYEFYTALQPLDTYFVQLGAALFGARPGHPILKHCIDTIKDDWHKKGAPTKTGPVHFTKSFYAMAGESNSKDIAFPAGYFYPLGSRDCVINRAKWLQDGAYAVHHWAKSWMPAKYRPREFKAINNDHQTKNWNE
jgi:mannosyltransferase OCH1-like enzyme